MVSKTGTLVMPPFRERLGTGCTKDSKDSGIDVQSKGKRKRNRKSRKKYGKLPDLSKKTSPFNIQEDNRELKENVENTIIFGLWSIVITITNLSFGIPFEILYPVKVNHVGVVLSYFFIAIWCIFALRYYLKSGRSRSSWFRKYPTSCLFSWMCMLFAFFLFIFSTLPQLGLWSYLVGIFYFMFFLNVSQTFL